MELSVAGTVSARRLQRSQSRSFARGLLAPSSDEASTWTAQLQSLQAELCALEADYEALRRRVGTYIEAVPESAVQLLGAPPERQEASAEDESSELRRVQALVDGEAARGLCSFFFVSAEWILQQTSSPPKFQDLLGIEGAVVQKTLDAGRAYRSEYASDELLAVSHRWETPSAPDTTGKQLERLQAHLRENRRIRYVWYDFWCMPQGNRSPSQKLHFVWMLKNVNLLYLGCSVLILLDISYLSRFWTQMEAWLSMQLGGTDGLAPAAESMRRCAIECLHTATEATRRDLIQMWASRTPEEAYRLLSQPDVQVTNQSDKTTQLEKVGGLDALVRAMHSSHTAVELRAAGRTWVHLLENGFSPASLMEAPTVDVDEAVLQALLSLASKFGGGVRELCLNKTKVWCNEDISAAQANALARVATLKGISLCGIAPDQTDFSKQNLLPPHAILLASDLSQSAVTGSLTSLTLQRNSLKDEGVSAVCEAVQSNKETKLASLDLRNCSFGPAGAKSVAAMAAVTGSLTKISLAANMLEEQGTKTICEALKGNETLKELDLSGFGGSNIGGPAGAKHVADMLSANGSLTSLDLAAIDLGPAGAEALAPALAANGSLTKLDVRYTSLDEATKDALKVAASGKDGFELLI